MNNKLIAIIALAIMMIAGTQSVYAKKSPFESGKSHGCDDAQIPNPANWYINGVNKDGESTGKSHHTAAFNQGYDAGFKECGYDNGVLIDNSQTNERVNTQNQAAETNQGVNCHVLIGSCNTGQNSSNKFAQANDQ